MPSLLDVAPAEINTREVDIRGTMVTVQGITGEVWQELYARYPALKTIVNGGGIEGINRAEGTISTAALIAAGTGHHKEPDHIVAAVRLSAEEQNKLLTAIIEISYPGEMFLPLAEGDEVRALLEAAAGRAGRASDTRS